jgi:ABC-type sugar transport system ATPase subunit
MNEMLDDTSSQIPWLEVLNIYKSYGGVQALNDVSVKISRGKIHGLIGANGAGKSTLIKCLAGAVIPDSGTIKLNGEQILLDQPAAASKLGFSFIHQEVSLIPNFDVFRNMALGIQPDTQFGYIRWKSLRKKAEVIRTKLSMTFSLDEKVENLSVAEKWLVLIGRALMQEATMIAMDEPTASLSIHEIENVHQIVRDLVSSGVSILFVSHRLDEVIELCDHITIFRDGKVISEFSKGNVTKSQLVSQIAGKETGEIAFSSRLQSPEIVLSVKDIFDEEILKGVSFNLHRGEILGFSGLVGAGRTELAKVIFGARKRTSGEIELMGKRINFSHPAEAVNANIGFVPEERRAEGIFGTQSIAFNITISSLSSVVISKVLPFLKVHRMRSKSLELSKLVTVNTGNMRRTILTLSGGNQQKVVIARWLGMKTEVLILDEPSRGVDVGAREEIHRVIKQLAEQGTSILVISSDNEELEMLCERVLTMVEGKITSESTGNGITASNLTSLSFARTPSTSNENMKRGK